MNRLFSLALVACVATLAVNASSRAEQRETSLLFGTQRLFSDFCIVQYNKIKTEIRTRANEKTADFFHMFFNAAHEIGDEVMTVQQRAVEEFTKSIQFPDQQVAEGPIPEEEVENLIEQGKKKIKDENNVVGRLVSATKSLVGNVLYNAANSAFFVRLAQARSQMNAGNLLEGISNTCQVVAEMDDNLKADLEEYKTALLAEHDEPEVVAKIQATTVQGLSCYTTKYISRLDAFCHILRHGSESFMKMLGLKTSFALPQLSE